MLWEPVSAIRYSFLSKNEYIYFIAEYTVHYELIIDLIKNNIVIIKQSMICYLISEKGASERFTQVILYMLIPCNDGP